MTAVAARGDDALVVRAVAGDAHAVEDALRAGRVDDKVEGRHRVRVDGVDRVARPERRQPVGREEVHDGAVGVVVSGLDRDLAEHPLAAR